MSILEKIRVWIKQGRDKYVTFNWWQKTLTWLGGFLLAFLMMDYIVMPLYTRLGQEYELPDVTEKPLAVAFETLEDQGFIPIVQDSAFDAHYAKGMILRQNPSPYSTVKKGRRVYLVMSSGEKPIYMPDLVKESITNAELRLRELGLVLNQIYPEYSEKLPYVDVVLRQSVNPGELVEYGKKINLTVSMGAPPNSQQIPRLVGKSLDRALKELEVVGVRRDSIQIIQRYRTDLLPRTIISQSVQEGTLVIESGKVELEVSTDQFPDQESRGGGGR